MGAPDQFEARLQALEDRLGGRMRDLEDRLVQFMAREFGNVAREFEAVRREITALERRVGFLGEVTAGIQSQMGALVKQNSTIESELGQIRGTQAGQQQAIEDLHRRVQRLEQGNGSGQQPKT